MQVNLDSTQLKAIFFDMGGTLETLDYDDTMRVLACEHILRVLRQAGITLPLAPLPFLDCVKSGIQRYMASREITQRELPPAVIWRDFILAEFVSSDERLATVLDAIGEELAFIWDLEGYRREMRPEVPSTLVNLRALGLRLGIISNVFSVHQVYHDLARFDIRGYFDPVILSVSFGYCKPAPMIFRHAAMLAQVPVAACVYVGDSLLHDIAGAQHAGFARAVWLDAPWAEKFSSNQPELKPDLIIHKLSDLLELLG
jgi:HAD superfamily hydrolase (TIGR01549 family)